VSTEPQAPPEREPLVAGSVGREESDQPELEDLTPETAFRRTVEEGRRRLHRDLGPLVATGLVGGIDISTGILALLLVKAATGSELLAGLAFGIGFISLTLARSELFTEDFLVPIMTVVARKARPISVIRLWSVTLASNLLGGWVVTGLIMIGFPSLTAVAVSSGHYYVNLGIGWRSFALALLGGLVITLMTWMQHTTESVAARLTVAVTTGFLLAAGRLDHAVVASLLMFCALHTSHPGFTYLDWARAAAWAALGNLVGGVLLVTVLRLLQVPHRVALERSRPEV
jgi:formate/nitrite transporter FocA (FNT family)